VGLGGVLEDGDALSIGELYDLIHVGGEAEKVEDKDGLGFGVKTTWMAVVLLAPAMA